MDMMMEGARSLGEYSLVPERYQDAARAGLGFFECRLPVKNRWGLTVQGPFDVSVRELEAGPVDPSGEPKFQVRWITEPMRPGVRFQPSSPKSEISVAFIVDDPGWFNRVLIADPLNSAYRVVAYHSKGGVIPAEAIRPWFESLREVLWSKQKQYNVISKDDTLIENFRDEQAAKDLMERKDDEHPDRLLYPRSRIVVTEVWDKTADAKRMLAENRGLLRGWTDSVEFKSKIRPQVEAMIKERMGATPEGLTLPRSLQDIMNMPPEQRKALRQFLLADEEETPAPVPSLEADTRKRIDLHSEEGRRLKREVLIARAKELDIVDPDALPNKGALVDAIIVAQNGDSTIPIGPRPKTAPVPKVEQTEPAEVVT
jgi:hypothetical protein